MKTLNKILIGGAAFAVIAGSTFQLSRWDRDNRPNFLSYCEAQAELTPGVGHTVQELLKLTGETDCRAADQKLQTLTNLSLLGKGISRLEPIAVLPQVRKLNLMANAIESVEPLRKLKTLEILYAGGNRIKDPEPLASLPLRSLSLAQNPVQDASALKGTVQLQFLDLAYTSIKNFRGFCSLEKLRDLSLVGTAIDASTLEISCLKKLEIVTLANTKIDSPDVFRGLPALKRVSFGQQGDIDWSDLAVASHE